MVFPYGDTELSHETASVFRRGESRHLFRLRTSIYTPDLHQPKQTESSLFIASCRFGFPNKSFWKDVVRCQDCDAQTKAQYGLTYLHRIHYLPITDVYAIHGTPLNKIGNQRILSWRQGPSPRSIEQLNIVRRLREVAPHCWTVVPAF